MTDSITGLIAEAREWESSEASWGDNGLVSRLANALDTERKRADGLTTDLDARFEHADHTAAKYWRRMREAEREMHARELHHFEAEQAMREALELIQPSRLMVPSDMGYEATTRDVIQARVILTRALNENGENDDQS